MEYKHLKFEIKAINDEGEFEGYAAVKGNVDAYGDIIENGAFKRTIRNKKNFPILFMHDPTKPVGLSSVMKEDEKGLFTRGRLDLSTELGNMVYSGLKMGYIDSMSIGYSVVQDDINKRGNRMLKEIKLHEYSLVTKGFAANELALVSGFKSTREMDSIITRINDLEMELKKRGKGKKDDEEFIAEEEVMGLILERLEEIEEKIESLEERMKSKADSRKSTRPFLMPQDSSDDTLEMKMVAGSSDLPIAGRERPWDGGEAHKRIFAWASNGDTFDPAKVKKAFFWFNGEDPQNKTAYKLPFADVIDGKLTAIPRGIFAVAGVLEGARGGTDINQSDQDAIKKKVAAYYGRMSKQFDDPLLKAPWEEKADVLSLMQEIKKYVRSDR